MKFIVSYLKNKEKIFFSLTDIKFDRNVDNIHKYCSMLIKSPLAEDYCPYKLNPLDNAGCSLTNGVYEDSTKSKEVSNTINALHALGFVTREKNDVKVTAFGIKFAKTPYGTIEMQEIITSAVLKYGPSIGVLKLISDCIVDNGFDTGNIDVGYPVTLEKVKHNGNMVSLSTGSRKDSNTRTKSCLLAWLVTAGFIRPNSQSILRKGELPHIAYRDYVNKTSRNDRKYTLDKLPKFLDGCHFITERPLNYTNLTKLNAALRENNMTDVRNATIFYESRINNRRFAIIFLLNISFEQKKPLAFSNIVKFFKSFPDLFIITNESFEYTIRLELDIANMAGIPFEIIKSDELFLKPLTGINLNELILDAPKEIVKLLQTQRI